MATEFKVGDTVYVYEKQAHGTLLWRNPGQEIEASVLFPDGYMWHGLLRDIGNLDG